MEFGTANRLLLDRAGDIGNRISLLRRTDATEAKKTTYAKAHHIANTLALLLTDRTGCSVG